ncbi:glycosyltransferase family 1 protein [Crenobacter sp. SG2303]|uniref:Glycosyltransferase family 1 protein n=1 Tax=Crenobacter oryzisoli TaxID=3056844 RepID=A0ABT7XSU0_9NEIS|nr:glycosyltransferase family 1 protein [Crenobacter sp. SG2303]MDN0076843.1 glycosyltransferase family 1 protein [Crenobacter sp. SG2303]
MRIVIDMQGAQSESRFRGIGRYTLALAQAIARQAGEHEVWLALNARLPESIPDLRAAFSSLIPLDRIRIFDVPCDEQPSSWMSRAAELIRESFLDSLQADVILVTSFFDGFGTSAVTSIGALPVSHRTAVILYDLIPLLNPEQYLPNKIFSDYYYRKIDWIKNADMLLAISESSQQEGAQHLGMSPEKIWNISAAIGPQFRPHQLGTMAKQALQHRLKIKRKPVLYAPGGFDQRKNFACLIEAYSLLDKTLRDQHQLVIASKLQQPQREELTTLAKRFGLAPDEMVLTGYVEDDELIELYSLAELFVFPSIHEGFGLPILEAMACGTAVIGSNRSSLPEVIGNADALFDPFSPRAIADKMTQVLTDTTFREQLRMQAQHQVQKFSWESCAKTALQALETLSNWSPSSAHAKLPVPSLLTLLEGLAAITDGEPTERELCAVAASIAFNASSHNEKQLLLDISSIVHVDAKSGIQRVVRSLLIELLTFPPHGLVARPVYFDDGIYRYANHFTNGIIGNSDECNDAPVDYCQDDIYLSLDLNMHLAEKTHSVLEHMKLMGVKLNFIVYDLLLVQRPDWWPASNSALFNEWLSSISKLGDNLVCISNAVAEELNEWLKLNLPMRLDNSPIVSSFHLGADIHNSLPTTGLAADVGMIMKGLQARVSFLMVGTIEPRKGHAQVLTTFERLWSEGCDVNLVIVGKRGWMVDKLINRLKCHPEKSRRLFWLEGISDEFLEKVYAASTCLIAASEGEGFGLPLIEAAQHKLPIIARDISVFREVASEHAYYFSGLGADDLEMAIKRWLELFKKGKVPVSDNMPWLTWKESAQQLLQAIFPVA